MAAMVNLQTKMGTKSSTQHLPCEKWETQIRFCSRLPPPRLLPRTVPSARRPNGISSTADVGTAPFRQLPRLGRGLPCHVPAGAAGFITQRRRAMASPPAKAMATAADGLRKGIAEFYDESSGAWEGVWGDHMHHGFYEPGAEASAADRRAAQVRMVEESLRFAGVPDDPEKMPKSIVDVGCGIGGSSRYLARKYGAKCQGITLSPVQAERARALAAAEGLADRVSFQVADALEQPFPDGQFDLVWSMESGEHMPDKRKFVSELARVAAPGGTIIIVTWCHRDLLPYEKSLRPDEVDLLERICDGYYLPAWCSAADYVKTAESLSLQDIKTADWSANVAPFWPAVIRSALTWRGFTSLLRSGWKTIRGALVMPLMIEGYNKGVIKFAIIACRKPGRVEN